MAAALREEGDALVGEVAGTDDRGAVTQQVARFLGLLELYREGLLAFEQVEALGDLHVRWTGEGQAAGPSDAGAEYDDEPASTAPPSKRRVCRRL